jgi:hypothetical protein
MTRIGFVGQDSGKACDEASDDACACAAPRATSIVAAAMARTAQTPARRVVLHLGGIVLRLI